jgi:hypothetical protein
MSGRGVVAMAETVVGVRARERNERGSVGSRSRNRSYEVRIGAWMRLVR